MFRTRHPETTNVLENSAETKVLLKELRANATDEETQRTQSRAASDHPIDQLLAWTTTVLPETMQRVAADINTLAETVGAKIDILSAAPRTYYQRPLIGWPPRQRL
jgi:hypothetical protein